VAARQISASSAGLQRYPKTSLLEVRPKQILKPANVGVAAAEESETSECSLDISCSTVTQSASSPSELDREGSSLPDGLTTVLKCDSNVEGNEMLSDCSTVSAENSTASARSSSDAEQENTSRQRPRVLKVDSLHELGKAENETISVLKDFNTNCGASCSGANVAVCQPVISSAGDSNKDQIVISASNRVQNYLASLGLPGISVYARSGFNRSLR